MKIDVLMAADDAYLPALAVAAHTFMAQASPADSYRLFVATPPDADLGGGRLLRHLEGMHLNLTCIHVPVPDRFERLLADAASSTHLPASSAYRLLACSLLPESARCLYLDTDITVLQDLAPLAAADLGGLPLGAVKDSFCSMTGTFPREHQEKVGISYDGAYFNAGVLVMDLERMRAEGLEERFLSLLPNGYPYFDQDVLNVACKGRVRLLPLKYNVHCEELRSGVLEARECFDAAERAAVAAGDIAILHYVGAEYNPWLFPQLEHAQQWISDAREGLPADVFQSVLDAGFAYRDSLGFGQLLSRARAAESVVIYGFTRYARECANRLLRAGVAVEAFFDRDHRKWGLSHADARCLPPEDLPSRYEPGKTLVAVAAQSVYRNVAHELVGRGVRERDIARYFHKGTGYYRELRPECAAAEWDDMDCIELAMATDAGYVSQLAVAVHSLLESSDPAVLYRLHVLVPEGLDLAGDARVRALGQRHGNLDVRPVPVPKSATAAFARAAGSGVYPETTFYRLLLGELLPQVERCVYLDCDVSVCGDVAPLARWDLRGHAVAAAPDPVNGLSGRFAARHQEVLGFPYDGTYFCAGVMVLDLARLRETDALVCARSLDLGPFPFADQDALNIALRGDVELLPLRFDVLAREWEAGIIHRCGVYGAEELAEVDAGGTVVLHYAGPEDKPWNLMDEPASRRWVRDARDILPADDFARLRAAWEGRVQAASLPAVTVRCRAARRAFIHGFTFVGRELADALLGAGVTTLAGFLDADTDKVGLSHAGMPCMDSARVAEFVGPGDAVVVAAQTSYSAIRKELLAAGISEDAIARYIPAKEGVAPDAPRVSVVVPVHGTEAYLPACLDSVLGQTLHDIEVICVDDASPDGCADILAGYATRDSRMRVVTFARNAGQGMARNAGLALARGRYVHFLDSDDMLEPRALEELAAYADAHELDGVFFDSSAVYETPQLARRHASYPAMRKGTYPAGPMTGRSLFEAFAVQREWTCYVQRQLWRRSFLEEQGLRFQEWPAHEDESFAFEAIMLAGRVAYLRVPYFIRRYRAGSVMTSTPTLRNFASYFQAYCRMTRFVRERGVESPAADANIARIYAALVRQHGELLEAGVDIVARFEGTALLGEYLAFAAAQKAWMHDELLSDAVLKQVRAAQGIYLYGAGVLARNAHAALVRAGLAVDGVLVTSMDGNPPAFEGHRVQAASSVAVREGALVVVAVTDGYRPEVEAVLDAAGWRHVYCKDGWLA